MNRAISTPQHVVPNHRITRIQNTAERQLNTMPRPIPTESLPSEQHGGDGVLAGHRSFGAGARDQYIIKTSIYRAF